MKIDEVKLGERLIKIAKRFKYWSNWRVAKLLSDLLKNYLWVIVKENKS
jgi:hypothetical protein